MEWGGGNMGDLTGMYLSSVQFSNEYSSVHDSV